MTDWSRMFEMEMLLVGIAGLVLTTLFVRPGDHPIDMTIFTIDPYYVLLLLFSLIGVSAAWSLWRKGRGSDTDS